MGPFAFLSDEWIEAARGIRERYAAEAPAPGLSVRMNLVVTAVPFGTETLDAHVDTSSGRLLVDLGHLEGPDLTVTVDYATAKAILVDQDAQAGLQAFMTGRVKVEGDMAKLLALQSRQVDGASSKLAEEIRLLTT